MQVKQAGEVDGACISETGLPVADRSIEGQAREAVCILQGVGSKVLACGSHLHATREACTHTLLCPVIMITLIGCHELV